MGRRSDVIMNKELLKGKKKKCCIDSLFEKLIE